MKLQRFLALLLTLAMVLPMAVSAISVSAEETVVELPTETITNVADQPTLSQTKLWNFEDSVERTVIYDFEDASQLDDFDLYTAQNSTISLSDGTLNMTKSGNWGYAAEAVLKTNFANVQSISVDIKNEDTSRFFGGIYLGGTETNLGVWTGVRKSNRTACNIMVATGTEHLERYADGQTTSHVSNSFYNWLEDSVNLTLVFQDNVINITTTIYRTDGTTKTLTMDYEYDPAALNGEIGLASDNTKLKFDNFTIVYKDSQLGDFDLYQSGESSFTVQDGVLVPNGTDGEMKAILNTEIKNLESLSVDIIPGATGPFNGGIYLGADNAGDSLDEIDALTFLLQSDFSGWSDAPNRIDIIRGAFSASDKKWTEVQRVISETGNGNALFSGGTKQALNLKLVFSGNVILLTLSLVSNPDKNIQLMYEVDPKLLNGKIGLRAHGTDVQFDNLEITYGENVPENSIPYDFEEYSQLGDFITKQPCVTDGKMTAYPTGVSLVSWEAVLNKDLKNVKSVSVDVEPVGTSRFFAGLSVGTTEQVLGIWAGMRRGNHTRSEIAVHAGQYMQAYSQVEAVEYTVDGAVGGFFDDKYHNPFNLTLTFETDKIIVLMTQLDDTSKTLSMEYDFDYSKFNGKVGLASENTNCKFDNFTITYSDDTASTVYDFEDIAQEADFVLYEPENSNVHISDSSLKFNDIGAINYPTTAILKEKIEDIQSVSVDMYPTTTAKFLGGIYIGGKDTSLCFTTGMRRANKSRCEILVNTGAEARENYSIVQISEYHQPGGEYGFFADLINNPVNMKLEFEEDRIIATVTRLDDATKTFTLEYEWDIQNFNGEIGLGSEATSAIRFDNFVITRNSDSGENLQGTSITYVNDGHNFYEPTEEAWVLSKDVTGTPYTVEAWVKIPKGVSDSKEARILTNDYRQPSISLDMYAKGRPRLVWAMENEDLTRTWNYYVAETDIRTGQWTHIAYSCDVKNDVVVCYINGEVMATWEDAGLKDIQIPDKVFPKNTFGIGDTTNFGGKASKLEFFGWIADVRMWNKPLTQAEVKDSMMTQYTLAKDGLMVNIPFNEATNGIFTDLSGNGNHTQRWDFSMSFVEDTSEPGGWSLLVMPDQQIIGDYWPDKLMQMYQWIVDNREKENMQMVINVGDIANHCGREDEWITAKEAYDLLPDDLPFIVCPGNHDYDTDGDAKNGYASNRDGLKLMNQYFPLSEFRKYDTYGGALSEVQGLEDNVANTYQKFEINGNKYLVLVLEYRPNDDALAWANDVVAAHPDHQVIVLTHAYINARGYCELPRMWNDFLKKHENIVMTIQGNTSDRYVVQRIDRGDHGNEVKSFVFDIQTFDASMGGVGAVALLRFNAEGTECNVAYYSILRDKIIEEEGMFTFTLPKQEHDYVAKAGMWSYESVTEAIANANGETVKILKDTDEAIVINNDVTIDLAGYTLSNVTVAEGAKLNLIDSTADYSGPKGSATVTGTVERFTEDGDDKYMVIGENGVYASHKYYVGLTHVSLDTNNTGFGYKARFYGDEVVQAQVETTGYDLWMTEDVIVTRTKSGFHNLVTLRLKNYMVEKYGETAVNAKAFIILNDGTRLESAVSSYSMRSMIELLNDGYADFTTAQLQNVAVFIKKNPVMESWSVANILAILQPAATVESITVADQTMTLMDGTTNTFTLNGAYCFTAQDTEQTVAYSDYADWIADYYISMDAEAGEGLYLAGNYGSYGWIAIPVEAGQTYTAVPVVETLLGTSLTYEEMVTDVVSFSCGVADTASANTGATVTVELRLTNPENAEEYITINTTALTIA